MKLRRIFFVVLPSSIFHLTSYILLSQPTTTSFRISYNYAAFDLPGNTIQAPNKDYVLGGTNLSFGGVGSILRLDTAGLIVWAKTYPPIFGINDVKNVSGGEYIISGSRATAGNTGLSLMRFTSSGSVVWGKNYRTNALGGYSEYGSKVIPTSDGGFLSAGYTYGIDPDGGGAQPTFDSANYFVVKTNGAGVLSWAKVILPTLAYENDHILNDVAEVSDGYIFVGDMSENGIVDDDYTDAVILKTDFSGNLLWMIKYGGAAAYQSFASAVTLPSGEVLISGSTSSRAVYIRINPATGAINSGYRYGSGFLPALDGGCIFRASDANYIMMGMYISFGAFNSFLFKINPATGTIIWGKRYPAFGGFFPEGQQTTDGGYIMNMMSGTFSWDYLVLKTDPTGQIPLGDPDCPVPLNYTPAPGGHGLGAAVVVAPTFVAVSVESVLAIAPINIAPVRTDECSYIMPIELLTFEGEESNNEVKLKWSTASEKDNNFFTVERSIDAAIWNEIGTVKGAGNSSTVQNYELVDVELSTTTTLYYRLKQTDYNGKYEYSKVISVNLSPPDEWKLIVSTISDEELKATLFISEDASVMIDIMDIQGRILKQKNIDAFKGANLIAMDLKNVAAGLFFVKVHNTKNCINEKFIKQ